MLSSHDGGAPRVQVSPQSGRLGMVPPGTSAARGRACTGVWVGRRRHTQGYGVGP